MRKVEIINRMVMFGMIKENDRKHFMRKNMEDLIKIYVGAMTIRHANMKKEMV